MNSISDSDLLSFIKGELNSVDHQNVAYLISQDKQLQRNVEHLKLLYNQLNQLDQLNKISTSNVQLKQKIDRYNQQQFVRKIVIRVKQLASILFFPVAAALLYLLLITPNSAPLVESYQEIEAVHGVVSKILLPDSSIVYLQGGSKMRYPVQFAEKRIVELQGQAYFQVKADTQNKFVVKCNQHSIEAYGTCFNVKAYEQDLDMAVYLESGSVDFVGENRQVIPCNTLLKYNKTTGSIDIKAYNNQQATGWKDGKLYFRDSPFEDVLTAIAHRYGVKIAYNKEKQLEENVYTAVFSDETVEQVFMLLQKTTPKLNWKIIEPIQESDNSYSIRHFYIY